MAQRQAALADRPAVVDGSTPAARPPRPARAFGRSPLPWLAGLLAVYLVAPIVVLLVHLVTSSQRGFGAPGLWGALVVSLVTASISTCLIGAFGIPLAFVLARHRGWLTSAVGLVVQLPLALPPLISGILLLSLVGPYTTLGGLVGGRLTDTLAGIVVAQTFVAAPFLVIAARSAFASIEPAYLEVAATLGMGEWRRFRQICLPIAAPGIGAGLLLAWLRAFGEFGATVILAYHPYTLPVFAYVQFSASGLSDTIAPATLAVAAALTVLVLSRLRVARHRRPTGELPPPEAPPARDGATVAFAIDRDIGPFHLGLAYRSASPRLAILGPSGAGKSSVLRCLAGLMAPADDVVEVGRRSLGGQPAEHRRIGYVPQDPSLFPHRTVWEQLTMAPGVRPGRARYWLDRLGLRELAGRLPSELSGGQRQRAAVARALSTDPELLVLDEPFAALDTPLRHELRRDLRRVLADLGMASVLVTHDPEEAALLADEILVLTEGRLLQADRRPAIFSFPNSLEAARLLGITNIGHGVRRAPDVVEVGGVPLAVDPRGIPAGIRVGTRVLWSVAPERIELVGGDRSDGLSPAGEALGGPPRTPARNGDPAGQTARYQAGETARYPARVLEAVDLGTTRQVEVELIPGVVLTLSTARPVDRIAPGSRCTISIPPASITAWEPPNAGSPPPAGARESVRDS